MGENIDSNIEVSAAELKAWNDPVTHTTGDPAKDLFIEEQFKICKNLIANSGAVVAYLVGGWNLFHEFIQVEWKSEDDVARITSAAKKNINDLIDQKKITPYAQPRTK